MSNCSRFTPHHEQLLRIVRVAARMKLFEWFTPREPVMLTAVKRCRKQGTVTQEQYVFSWDVPYPVAPISICDTTQTGEAFTAIWNPFGPVILWNGFHESWKSLSKYSESAPLESSLNLFCIFLLLSGDLWSSSLVSSCVFYTITGEFRDEERKQIRDR